mmetsp:Transcript_28681/g.59993  ORF Transcript_28681/g.59993 Transcript_28681/m.59993 type:complete len:844 (+) Transcript_28681:429-2960(+)
MHFDRLAHCTRGGAHAKDARAARAVSARRRERADPAPRRTTPPQKLGRGVSKSKALRNEDPPSIIPAKPPGPAAGAFSAAAGFSAAAAPRKAGLEGSAATALRVEAPARRSSSARMASRSAGLARKPSKPDSLHTSRTSCPTSAEKATMGRAVRPSSLRMRTVASMPSMTGMRRSMSTKSKSAGAARIALTASSPLLASRTVHPSFSSIFLATLRQIALSSTASTRSTAGSPLLAVAARRGDGGSASTAGSGPHTPSWSNWRCTLPPPALASAAEVKASLAPCPTSETTSRSSSARRVALSAGLATKPSKRASRHSSRTSLPTSAEKATTGRESRRSSLRICRVASMPSMTGMRRSMSTKSKLHGASLISITASSPLDASSTVHPSDSSIFLATFWQMALSSTTRQCGFRAVHAASPTAGGSRFSASSSPPAARSATCRSASALLATSVHAVGHEKRSLKSRCTRPASCRRAVDAGAGETIAASGAGTGAGSAGHFSTTGWATCAGALAAGRAYGFCSGRTARGTLNEKTVFGAPGWDSTSNTPPMLCTMLNDTLSPSPSPSLSLARSLIGSPSAAPRGSSASAGETGARRCQKRWKALRTSSASTPWPVSVTEKRIRPSSSAKPSSTRPAAVCLSALVSRCRSTRERYRQSPSTRSGTCGQKSTPEAHVPVLAFSPETDGGARASSTATLSSWRSTGFVRRRATPAAARASSAQSAATTAMNCEDCIPCAACSCRICRTSSSCDEPAVPPRMTTVKSAPRSACSAAAPSTASVHSHLTSLRSIDLNTMRCPALPSTTSTRRPPSGAGWAPLEIPKVRRCSTSRLLRPPSSTSRPRHRSLTRW